MPHGHRRAGRRRPRPGEAVGTVGLPRRREAGAEEDLTGRRVFGQERLFAPADERVAVRQRLIVALAAGEDLPGITADELDGHDLTSILAAHQARLLFDLRGTTHASRAFANVIRL
jgi:hypothetical protein